MQSDTCPSSPHVVIIGCGSWGTALATVLCHSASNITLLGRNPEVISEINSAHRNERYLPGAKLDPSITASEDLSVAREADLILFVVPSSATRSV